MGCSDPWEASVIKIPRAELDYAIEAMGAVLRAARDEAGKLTPIALSEGDTEQLVMTAVAHVGGGDPVFVDYAEHGDEVRPEVRPMSLPPLPPSDRRPPGAMRQGDASVATSDAAGGATPAPASTEAKP